MTDQPEQNAAEPVTDAKEKGTSDDKCIGNRKIRTVLLCTLILVFSVFAAGYLFLIVKRAKDADDAATGCSVCEDGAASRITGANCIVAGLIMTMFFCLVAMATACIKTCDPNKTKAGCFPGLGLILSGSLYTFGWFWYINADKEVGYNFLSDAQQQDADAKYLGWFGEALIYGATVILMGVDLAIPSQYLLEDEFKRLFLNMGILCAQSILTMPAYFILADTTGAPMIGAGYIIVMLSTAAYLIIFFASCCAKGNLKDSCAVRGVISCALILGGVITAIGYYWFAGGYETLGSPGDDAKRVAYYIGYTILVGGLCGTWAFDIAWDDIKND